MASYAFRIVGIHPTDSVWHAAGDDVHRWYWREIVKLVLKEKDRELAEGRDRFGRKMFPIAASTRRRGRMRSHTGRGTADNPPLVPAQELSRTRTLFTGRAFSDHAEFYWKFDWVTQRHWGAILGIHREGSERLPVRDVIGLSPGSLRRVQVAADKLWADWKRGHAMLRKVELLEVHVPIQPLRPVPPRTHIVEPKSIDLSRFTFGTAGSEEQLRQAIAEGSIAGYRRQGETTRRSYGGTPPAAPPIVPPKPPPPGPPARPAPVPWVHPPRPVPGRRPVPPAKPPKPPKPAPVPAGVIAQPMRLPNPPGGFPPSPNPPGAHATIPRAVRYLQSRGIKVEPMGRSTIEKKHGPNVADEIPAAYNTVDQTIYINETHIYWHDPQGFMADAARRGEASTAKPSHILIHEVGHAEHHAIVGTVQFRANRTVAFSAADRATIASEVSFRATENPNEFIAEVYAGMSVGRKYSPRVDQLYQFYDGPTPPSLNPRPTP
jgi:hypothetical protein